MGDDQRAMTHMLQCLLSGKHVMIGCREIEHMANNPTPAATRASRQSEFTTTSADRVEVGSNKSIPMALKFDEIGYWSEVKLDIIKEYAAAYSSILEGQMKPRFIHVYIDGFSGAGLHVGKKTGEFILGSPLNALNVEPPFKEYYLVDLNGDKIEHLRSQVGDRPDVRLCCGDCNQVLLEEVFPRVRYQDYRRGLCVLDPYGLHLNWEVLLSAGQMGTLDIFLNFPIMDMNRNALWRNPDRVSPDGVARMTAFWGDESWRSIAYPPSAQTDMFIENATEKADNTVVAGAFRNRLKDVAGFNNVPEPLPMRNSTGATVYYLFFASQKPVAQKIVTAIFDKYAQRAGGSQ